MIKKATILTVIIFLALAFYWRGLNAPADKNGQEQIFLINQGATAEQIALDLKKDNLIKSAFYFEHLIKQSRQSVKAGKYFISPKLTTKEIVKILTMGDAISDERTIKIIEGWNIKDINNYLNKIMAADSFLNIARQKAKDLKFKIALDKELADGLPADATLEGFLFPDTYRIGNDAKVEDIINKMLANFNKKLTPAMRAEMARQKKTVYEIITMASIIEKEVRSQDDMKIVSGIFWDRIKNGQGLESCATLAYVLGVNKAQYSLEDTKINSPYNTYKYRGLPPGPIANPGLNAIMAAIYPALTSYNYFLSDPATGKTIFSKTLDEHNMNKARYLK
ncbi:MAG: endolytic transglycosylase MltG [Patescibacteria group bacterium]|nr:endolytic transglycosylase MltG [Patescibacteria group bacterium]